VKAVVITRPGGPEVLEIRELDDPQPRSGEVAVRVRASALNRADLLQRRGRYHAPPGVGVDVPGLEFAGEVESLGPGVTGLATGDRVMGIVAGGAHAERLVVDRGSCLPVPAGLGWEEAAAVPEAFLTAFDALFELGGLAPSGTVVVTAAASGVGTAAVQLAREGGAHVVATSRSPDKRSALERLGADRVVDPDGPELERAVSSLAPAGADLVIDLVGGPALPRQLATLRTRGRLVLVGLLGGARAELDLGLLLARRATVVGTLLRPRSNEEKAALARAFAARALPWLEAGRVRPVVDRVFPLDLIAEAHDRMEHDRNFGKIVLRMTG
jgi:putative PIG3 family NAD(P)H quinone oxidoreductase